MRIADDITQLIGNTPLVRLRRVTDGAAAQVVAKLEFFNPAGSVKDRIGVSMIDAAERDGLINPDTIDHRADQRQHRASRWPSSCAAARATSCILTMPETMSLERRQLLRAFGAELVLTPGAGGHERRDRQGRGTGQARDPILHAAAVREPGQPGDPPQTTAEEIWNDTDGKVDILVSGVGTGGTITGVGEVLKERKPAVQAGRRRADRLARC